MNRQRSKAFEIWNQMERPALLRLATAVFILFAVLGPLTVLMESRLHVVSWAFVAVQTIASGGLAASIILFGRKKWWRTTLIALFWSAIIMANSGGLSFVGDERGLHVVLGDFDPASRKDAAREALTVEPAQMDAIYTQRSILGAMAILFIATGYGLFIRVIGKELQNRAQLATEIKIAQGIQRSLLPDSSLTLPWCSANGVTLPASEVGGDYFDIIKLSDSMVGVVVADVTGHGIGAGILAAMTKSAFHLALAIDPMPAEMLKHLNRTLADLSDDKTFVTFAYALFDNRRKRAFIATAGHPPILHFARSGKAAAEVRTPSLALGMRPDTIYANAEVSWDSHDTFLLFTDGVIEAVNSKNEQFGEDRLRQVMSGDRVIGKNPCEGILSALREFTGHENFRDDVSLVALNIH